MQTNEGAAIHYNLAENIITAKIIKKIKPNNSPYHGRRFFKMRMSSNKDTTVVQMTLNTASILSTHGVKNNPSAG